MFSFSKLGRRGKAEKQKQQRDNANSPYEYALPSAPYHHHDGSSVSLPTGVFGARSYSSLHRDLYTPTSSTRPPTGLDDSSNSNDASESVARRVMTARARNPGFTLRRPSTFHELDPMLLNGRRGERRHHTSADLDHGMSPVALPQKALALLGLEERGAAFERPASPMVNYGGDGESIYNPASEGDSGRAYRDSDLFSGYTEKTYMGDMDIATRQTFQFTQLGPPPDRLYFRPESLCSSFSTSSGRTEETETTAMTVMTPTSPLYCGSPGGYDQECGTLTSESTIKGSAQGISMLNLDSDTDEDDDYDVQPVSPDSRIPTRRISPPVPPPPPPPCRPGELPLEVALQICNYFSTETHIADLPQASRGCPVCNLRALHALTLTSRAWSSAATRILYRTIALDFGDYSPATRVLTPFSKCVHPETKEPLHQKIDVEQKLPLLYRTLWDSPEKIPQMIEGIKVPRGMFSITKYPLSAILQKCHNLRFIDYSAMTGSGKDILATLEPLAYIEKWTFRRASPNPALILSSQGAVSPPLPSATFHNRTPSTPLSASSSASTNTTIILRLLAAWQHLHTLTFDNIDFSSTVASAPFPISPLSFPPSLSNLSLHSLPFPTAPQILDQLPPLQSLTISNTPLNDRLHRFLARHGNSLLSLHLANIPDVAISIEDLLTYTPNLRRLHVVGGGIQLGTLREDIGAELTDVEVVDVEGGLKDTVGWLVEASKREAVKRVVVGGVGVGDGAELGRLQMECWFNGVELVVKE